MNYLLCRGRAVGTEKTSPGVVHAALYSSADPFQGVVPGDVVQLGLSVAVEGAPFGYAYLQEKYLADTAEIISIQQLEYFPRQRWFRVRAEPGQTGTGVLSLRVKQPKKEPRLRPQITVAVPERAGRKLIRTGSLRDHALMIRSSFAPGLRIVTAPGTQGSVNMLTAVPEGSTPISLTQPRFGTAQVSHDGWLTYLPHQGFAGYDRFEYTVGTPDGRKITAPVNVHVGGLDATPGAFPEQLRTTDFQHWQWSTLTGEMPWPRPGETNTRNG